MRYEVTDQIVGILSCAGEEETAVLGGRGWKLAGSVAVTVAEGGRGIVGYG